MRIGDTIQINGNNNVILSSINSSNITINFEYSKYLNFIPSVEFREIIGRRTEIREVYDLLNIRQVGCLNLIGLAGIGKTTLAKVFIETYEEKYKHIVWVSDKNLSLKNSIGLDSVLSANLFLKFSDEYVEQKFIDIVEALKSLKGRNLLVIDGFDFMDYDNVRVLKLVYQRLRNENEWQIIVTSRIFIEDVYSFEVGSLSFEDSANLFYHYYSIEKDTKQLEKLLSTLGGHTLAIELLAKTGQKSNLR